MDKGAILQYLQELNQELAKLDVIGEVCLYGGAVMCLVYFLDTSHLKVYVPEPDYLLAMKTLAARVDTTDRPDIEFLIKTLGLTHPAQVFAILEKYYPRHQVKPATQYFVEELFGQ